jgi:hypothetical protein
MKCREPIPINILIIHKQSLLLAKSHYVFPRRLMSHGWRCCDSPHSAAAPAPQRAGAPARPAARQRCPHDAALESHGDTVMVAKSCTANSWQL